MCKFLAFNRRSTGNENQNFAISASSVLCKESDWLKQLSAPANIAYRSLATA